MDDHKEESHNRQKTIVKARLIAHRFQKEKGSSLSDSPTVMSKSNKLFTTIAANEGFSLMWIDIRAAFLQSRS